MEFELKFGVPADALASLAAALRQHGAQRVRLQARYFDTPDRLLAAHFMSLRLRREGRRWVQTLKAQGDSIAHRHEHEVVVATPELDPTRHAASDAGRALAAVLKDSPLPAWREQYATDIRRLVCPLLLVDGSEIEVALDSGRIMADGAVLELNELEIEHKSGPLDGLFALAAAWVDHGGLWLSATTKAARGERLLLGGEPPAVRAVRPQPGPPADARHVMQAVLRTTLAQVVGNAGTVADGAAAAEHVHQLRVGLRRLRTALRELAPLAPAIEPRWSAVLSRTFGQLGLQRDQQAVAEAVRPLLEAVEAPRLAWQPAPGPTSRAVVVEREFQRTLVELLALAHAADDRFAAMSRNEVRAFMGARLDKLWRAVVRDGRHFERLEVEHQHRVRKRLKRLRYVSEFATALWPDAAPKPWFSRLSRAQDALGLHNDVSVAAAAFRNDAAEHPGAWFAAGYLQAHLAVTARAGAKAMRRVGTAQRYWRR